MVTARLTWMPIDPILRAPSAPGSAVGLTIVRQGQEQFLQATVGELAAEKAPALSNNIENER